MSGFQEITIDDEIADIRMGRPHVVILGAGASRAVCPNGDRNGRKLPLMADFAECPGISDLLENWGIDPAQNFETTYSGLHDAGETAKLEQLNKLVERYFISLELPDHPTIYDHLVMSLRGQDLIATFNWDPLLLQAYVRNHRRLSMPRLVFLHGNVRTGYCETDRAMGLAGHECRKCGLPFKRTPLLYPVANKDYAANPAIAWEWEALHEGIHSAFMITIFGYSCPRTDQAARDAMQAAWGPVAHREMEQTAFITLQADDEIRSSWREFIHTHHFEVQTDFYDSWIAKHPRRTGEAYLSQYIDAHFVTDNPIPRDLDLDATSNWFERFLDAEQRD